MLINKIYFNNETELIFTVFNIYNFSICNFLIYVIIIIYIIIYWYIFLYIRQVCKLGRVVKTVWQFGDISEVIFRIEYESSEFLHHVNILRYSNLKPRQHTISYGLSEDVLRTSLRPKDVPRTSIGYRVLSGKCKKHGFPIYLRLCYSIGLTFFFTKRVMASGNTTFPLQNPFLIIRISFFLSEKSSSILLVWHICRYLEHNRRYIYRWICQLINLTISRKRKKIFERLKMDFEGKE